MGRFLAIAMAAVLLACGGDSTAPPPFPSVAGTYRIDITFSGFPSSVANGSGTISIVQASRNAPDLAGSANVTVLIGGQSLVLTRLTSASVTEGGAIRFQLPPLNTSSVWGFDGTVTAGGAQMTGTHLLVGTSSSSGGTWTASRQ
jgi:hypothetical protein